MALQILILLVSLFFVVFGADFLVDGSAAVARKSGISEFVIGLTIVGFGTSCPELVVSLSGALSLNSDISAGNVLGSNIVNTLLILGLTAVLTPIAITKDNLRRDIPLTILVTALFVFAGMSRTFLGIGEDCISRIWGIIFLILFAGYMFLCFKFNTPDEVEMAGEKQMGVFKAVVLIFAGLAALVAGGHFFVESAEKLARMIGVSDKFIAVTVLAGGTSLPELATCIVAAAKKKGALALGNILGSNVFNILLILGISSIVHPISLEGMDLVDMGVLLLSALLVLLSAFTFKKNKIDRADGAIFLVVEALYLTYLFVTI